MQIYLPEVRSKNGEAVDYSFRCKLDECYDDFHDGGTLGLKISVTFSGSNLIVTGTMETSVGMNCARCLKDFKHKFKTDFAESFSYIEKPEGDYTRKDLSAETADELVVRGDYLYLEEYFRQLIILAHDYSPLCNDNCEGLCAGCGQDLNESNCSCKGNSSGIDIRMLKLKELQK